MITAYQAKYYAHELTCRHAANSVDRLSQLLLGVCVVGQVLRYMGFVMEELAEPGQRVRGVIIALDDDSHLRRALAAVPTVDFYRYQISFKLQRG